MKSLARQFLTETHLLGTARGIRERFRRLQRKGMGHDLAMIQQYLSAHEERKLHIGCGGHVIDGWLNADLWPTTAGILHLDATKTFPFRDGSFDCIFSEHMIEHISYSNGLVMLQECHRVLRSGSTIRISTPDLQFLIDLYRPDKSELQLRYIKWATDSFNPGAPYADDTFVINHFVRAWGHLFIYDEKTLRASLETAGFVDIVRCELNESGIDSLRQLENEQRMPSGFLRLESLTLEGTKPIRR